MFKKVKKEKKDKKDKKPKGVDEEKSASENEIPKSTKLENAYNIVIMDGDETHGKCKNVIYCI